VYPVSALFARGLSQRASQVTSTLAGRSLGEISPTSGRLSWASDGRKVTAKLDLSVPDPHGVLALMSGPLGWAGQQLVVRSGVSRSSYEELIPCGSYRVDDSGAGPQAWSTYRNGSVARRGSSLSPTASDLLSILEDDESVTVDQPTAGTTVRQEVIRIVGGRMPIASSWPGISDPVVSSAVTYDQNRLTTLCSLAASVGAVVWAGRAGELQFIPQPVLGATPVWTATAKQAVEIAVAGSRTGVYNRIIVEGSDVNSNPLRGVADIPTGVLAVTAPFGVVTYRHNDPLAKTQESIDASARTLRDTVVGNRTVRAKVTLPADPSLDPLDVVAVTDPEGKVWTGPVMSCEMPLGPGLMTIEISVPLTAVM
jgi:hypothetical protein